MFTFQFLNDKNHNYVSFGIIVSFMIQKLKSKHLVCCLSQFFFEGTRENIFTHILGLKNYFIINGFFFSFQCNNCKQLVIHPDQRFSFFSDYSQIVSCPHCGVQEAHFAKNLPSIFAFIPRRGVTRVNSA